MPELPEVETIVRQLAPVLPGHTIRTVGIRWPDVLGDSPGRFRRALKGAEILRVDRRGKNIVLNLSPPAFLVVNLGMTGRLLFSGTMEAPFPDHMAVRLVLDPPALLFYADTRRFGLLRVFLPEAWERESARLGPEPLERRLTPRRFHSRLSESRSPIRSWLLDQRKMAGVGNIYAAEALFRSGVHPTRPASTLDLTEAERLLNGIREVLRAAIKARGTTLRDYRTASGQEGGFLPRLLVYGREGEACVTCKTPVARVVFGNRSAFFCPRCQPEKL